MNKLKRTHTILFAGIDAAMAALAWFTFFFYRKGFIDVDDGFKMPIGADEHLYVGLFVVPAYWLLLYTVAGSYTDVWRRSRLREIANTFLVSVLGVIILFFLLLLDDKVNSYRDYYTLLTLLSLHFGLTVLARMFTAAYIKSLIRKKQIGFNTIIIGSNEKALSLVNEIEEERMTQGYIFKGYVNDAGETGALAGRLPCLGPYERLPDLIDQLRIEEVILTIESTKHQDIIRVNNLLEGIPINLKIVPDIYDMMSGSVKMQNVMGTALIEIKHEAMPQWQKLLKRGMDVVLSLLVLLLFSPVYLAVAIAVKRSSKGPVLFRQIRIGQYGRPFLINKFRTMYTDAEAEGPALSRSNDKRITPVGLLLRKYRLDEIPQFYNVLIGEMSLVGPRPERKFFIDQIVRIAPHYKQLHRVRPGITSWGQVKYGYAENVDQMVERLKFDILYIENMSLAVDIRILIYTIKTIVQGSGK